MEITNSSPQIILSCWFRQNLKYVDAAQRVWAHPCSLSTVSLWPGLSVNTKYQQCSEGWGGGVMSFIRVHRLRWHVSRGVTQNIMSGETFHSSGHVYTGKHQIAQWRMLLPLLPLVPGQWTCLYCADWVAWALLPPGECSILCTEIERLASHKVFKSILMFDIN